MLTDIFKVTLLDIEVSDPRQYLAISDAGGEASG